MAKYIINISDEILEFMNNKFDVFIEPEVKVGECKHYKVRLDDTEITPYTEPDEDEIRQKEEEYGEKAWQLFRNICELNGTECIEAFDTISCRTVLDEMTYSEAKDKYNAWKKSKDEIRVGDELEQTTVGGIHTGTKCIVVKIDGDNKMNGIRKDGSVIVCSSQVKRWWRKTGRSFPEVVELLKKMREE